MDPILLFLPIFFICFWLILCSSLSWLGGWTALGKRYKAPGKPEGKRFWMQSVRCGWVDYNGCVTVWVAPHGLYMAVWLPFRSGHPPLFLPWSALHILEIHESWWASYVIVAVDNPPVARLRLPLRVVDAAKEIRVDESPPN
jgi:hypothetical protein